MSREELFLLYKARRRYHDTCFMDMPDDKEKIKLHLKRNYFVNADLQPTRAMATKASIMCELKLRGIGHKANDDLKTLREILCGDELFLHVSYLSLLITLTMGFPSQFARLYLQLSENQWLRQFVKDPLAGAQKCEESMKADMMGRRKNCMKQFLNKKGLGGIENLITLLGRKDIQMEDGFVLETEAKAEAAAGNLEQLVRYGAVKVVETLESMKKRKNNDKNDKIDKHKDENHNGGNQKTTERKQGRLVFPPMILIAFAEGAQKEKEIEISKWLKHLFELQNVGLEVAGTPQEDRLSSFVALKSHYHPQLTTTIDNKQFGGLYCSLGDYYENECIYNGTQQMKTLLATKFLFYKAAAVEQLRTIGNTMDETKLRRGVVYLFQNLNYGSVDVIYLIHNIGLGKDCLRIDQIKGAATSDENFSYSKLKEYVDKYFQWKKIKMDTIFTISTVRHLSQSVDVKLIPDNCLIVDRGALAAFLGHQFRQSIDWTVETPIF